MDATELRALADALEPMARAPRFEDFDVPAFCAWVRACADAKPVAWMHDGFMSTDYERVQHDEMRNRSCGFKAKPIIPLYTHPAPTTPHHAMLDSHRRLVEQAIQSAEHPSGMSTHDGKAHIDASILRRMLAIIDSLPAAPQEGNVWKQIIPDNVPQAEPKREPLHKLLEYADLSDDCQYGTLSASVVRDLVNEALGIGGSDDE